MIPRRRGIGSSGAALALLAAAAVSTPAARAESSPITPREEDGQIVYTMRPSRKPGAGDSNRVPAERVRPHRLVRPTAELEDLIHEVSAKHELDPRLVTTVIGVESAFNRLAVSPKGARGLMQLMPATARQYGVQDPHDPRENVEGGVAYLKDLIRRYGGDLELALAAYNAGPEAVERAGGVPRYRETRDYLKKIESHYGGGLTANSTGDAGGTTRRASGPIVYTRDASGVLVATNAKGPGTRIVRKPRKVRR